MMRSFWKLFGLSLLTFVLLVVSVPAPAGAADVASVLTSAEGVLAHPPDWLNMVLTYLLIDAPMRLWKTDKPTSILITVSAVGHQICEIGHSVCDIVADLDKIIDGVIPQRVAKPPTVVAQAAPSPAAPGA